MFITGAASGLGEATARWLHAMGCNVALADVDLKKLEQMKSELVERVFVMKCDVTKEDEVKEAIDSTVAHFGNLHVAIPCAGVGWIVMTLTSKKTLDTALMKKMFDINVMGSIFVSKYASYYMAKNEALNDKGEKGLIVFVSS